MIPWNTLGVKATAVSVRLRILFVTLQNTNALPSAITWDELNNLAPSDCIKKRQQAFWRRCRGTVATLSTDSVILISSFFFLLDSTSTPRYPWSSYSFHSSLPQMGAFSEPSPSSSSNHELDPGFIAMARKRPFSGEIHEDPYEHLLEFEELCSGLEILGMTQEALQWKLFSFSLIERAEQWYTRTIGNMSGDWEV